MIIVILWKAGTMSLHEVRLLLTLAGLGAKLEGRSVKRALAAFKVRDGVHLLGFDEYGDDRRLHAIDEVGETRDSLLRAIGGAEVDNRRHLRLGRGPFRSQHDAGTENGDNGGAGCEFCFVVTDGAARARFLRGSQFGVMHLCFS